MAPFAIIIASISASPFWSALKLFPSSQSSITSLLSSGTLKLMYALLKSKFLPDGFFAEIDATDVISPVPSSLSERTICISRSPASGFEAFTVIVTSTDCDTSSKVPVTRTLPSPSAIA